MEKSLVLIIIIFLLVFSLIKGMSFLKRAIRKQINKKTRELIGVSVTDLNNIVNTVKAIENIAEEPEIKSVSGATDIYLKQINRDFPEFHFPDSENAIKNFIIELLDIQYGNAITFKTSNVSDELINTIEKSNINHSIDNIKINKISICNYKKSSDYATITYQCSVGFNLNDKRYEKRYKIEYTLRLANQNIATHVMTCHNCGATLESTTLSNCEYCDAKIIKDTILNWLFSSVVEM